MPPPMPPSTHSPAPGVRSPGPRRPSASPTRCARRSLRAACGPAPVCPSSGLCTALGVSRNTVREAMSQPRGRAGTDAGAPPRGVRGAPGPGGGPTSTGPARLIEPAAVRSGEERPDAAGSRRCATRSTREPGCRRRPVGRPRDREPALPPGPRRARRQPRLDPADGTAAGRDAPGLPPNAGCARVPRALSRAQRPHLRAARGRGTRGRGGVVAEYLRAAEEHLLRDYPA